MIVLDDVTAAYQTRERFVAPLRNVSVSIPGDKRVGILGAPKSGKSTLIRVLCGLDLPTGGRVYADSRVSYPIGSPVGIVSNHSLRRNCLFAARVYRSDANDIVRLVAEAANIRKYLDMPFKDVPAEVALRFRYALSLTLPFDTYLIDSVPLPRMEDSAGLNDLFESRAADSGLVICTGNEALVEKYCDLVYLLRDGKLFLQPDLQEAVRAFREERRFAARVGAATRTAQEMLLEARSLIRAKNFEYAEKRSREFYDAYPESLEALLLLADLALAKEDPSTAMALAKQTCRLYPLAAEPWTLLHKLLTHNGEANDVKYWAMRMTNHEDVRIRMMGARAIENVGSTTEALEAWRKVVGPDPDSPVGLLEAAQFEFNTKNFLEAQAILATVLDLDPAAWRALLLKAKAERALGQFDDLADTVSKLAAIKPEACQQFLPILEKQTNQENNTPDSA